MKIVDGKIVSSGHCCQCSSICGHIGGPFYCDQHLAQMRLFKGSYL